MNPWKNPNWKMINFADIRFFRMHEVTKAHSVHPKVADLLFLGSCDINGHRQERYWHEILCEQLGLQHNAHTFIGNSTYTLGSMVRRVYTYLKSVESAPKVILLVCPIATHEHIVDGTCYSINPNPDAMDFLYRIGAVEDKDIRAVSALQRAYKQTTTREQEIYNFCKEFSFLEMICKAYGIKLLWTPNRTKNALPFFQNVDELLDAHDFAKSTFIGYDSNYDFDEMLDSPTAASHKAYAELFKEHL